jgi:hypothetical protein
MMKKLLNLIINADMLVKLLGILVICIAALMTCVVVEEVNHPCLRSVKRHSDFTVIGYDYKMRPIYGPGEVTECVERQP